MMPKTIPRIGKQNILEAIEKLVMVVRYKDSLTEAQLRNEMEKINENHETKIFKNINEWFIFTRADENRSIHIIQFDEDGTVKLTKEGKELVDAHDFKKAAFKLLERKSKKGFTYFDNTIVELDNKMKKGTYDMGNDLIEEVNNMMKESAKGNLVTAGAIASLLRGFDIVYQENKRWKINPVEYSRLRGGKKDIAEDIIKEKGKIDLADLSKILNEEFEWSEKEFEDIINELINEDKIAKDKYEGKIVLEAVKY